MICTNRIYKGETFEVSIPFMVEGWSDLYVEYFTNGQYKVTRTADELIIDEYTITAEFSGNDLDLLADGVLRYTLYYTLEGVAYTKSTNTPYYLKTPVAYSAMTPTDYYHEGEVVGKAEGYLSGYTQAESTIRSNAVSLNVTENGVYSANTDDNIYFNNVVVNVESPCEDCTEAYVSGMNATFIGSYFNDDTQWAEIEDVHIPKPISGKSVTFRIDFAVFDEPTEINKKKVLLSSKDMNNQDAPYLEFYIATSSGTGGTIKWYAKVDVRHRNGVKTYSSAIAVNTMYQLYATISYRNENSFTWSWRIGTFTSGTEALSYLGGQTSIVDGTMTINGTKDSSSTETPVVGISSGLFIEKIVISAEGQQKNNVKWVNGNMRDLITHRDNAGYCMVNGQKTIKTISGLYINGSTAYSGEYLSVVNEVFESGTTIGYQSGMTQGRELGFYDGRYVFTDYQAAIGVYGPATIRFYDRDTDYPMKRYIRSLYEPKENYVYNIDTTESREDVSFHFSGNGFHIIWIELRDDCPLHGDWITISNNTGDVNLIVADGYYDIHDPFHDEIEYNEVDFNTGNDVYKSLLRMFYDNR